MSPPARIVRPFSVEKYAGAATLPPGAAHAQRAAPTEHPGAAERACNTCRITKPLSEYPQNKGFGGRMIRSEMCRDCIIKAQKERARRSGRQATRRHTCPDCAASYVSPVVIRGGVRGKQCPGGHWYSTVHLLYHEKHGCLPKPRTIKPKPAPSAAAAKRLPVQRAERLKFARIGLAERTDQLTLALRTLLTGHDRLMQALPPNSPVRGLAEGSFGRAPQLCREILGA